MLVIKGSCIVNICFIKSSATFCLLVWNLTAGIRIDLYAAGRLKYLT